MLWRGGLVRRQQERSTRDGGQGKDERYDRSLHCSTV